MARIEWCMCTWNPVIGCSMAGAECSNCYAMRMAWRLLNMGRAEYTGLTRMTARGPVWTGEVRCLPERLQQPFHWRKPRLVFVNSMSDLFHEDVPDAFIASVFDVVGATPQHTYQLLTKRPDRLAGRFRRLPNVWIGTSVGTQEAVERWVPPLLRVDAQVRFLSVEPLLEALELAPVLATGRLDWVIVGGESGPGARPCSVAWVRNVVRQCRQAGVPVFLKQLGRRTDHPDVHDAKGGDPSEWPIDLRIREYPSEKGDGEAQFDLREEDAA